MKHKFIVLLLLAIFTKSFAQDSKFSIELNYPLAIDNNFIGDDYSGIIDLGIDYKFTKLSPIDIGVSLNSSLMVNNSNLNSGSVDFKVTTYIIQPKLFGELNIESLKALHPSVGLGYTFMVFDPSGTISGVDVSGENDTQSGFNFNLGLAYDLSEKLFAQIQYDFVKLNPPSDVPDITFNTNVNILKIGLGYRL